jgi:transposase InsO family protein
MEIVTKFRDCQFFQR